MATMVIKKNNKGNAFKAASIKAQYIDNIIASAKECALIQKIMLFGSTLEGRCRKESDIDIAVIGDEKKLKALRSKEYRTFTSNLYDFDYGQHYDILYFTESELEKKNGVVEDIRNGALIYERA